MVKVTLAAVVVLLAGGQVIFRLPSGESPVAAARMPSNSTTLPDAVWADAGVDGGIPTSWPNCDNTACNDLAPGGSGTVSTATINSAISGAQVGGTACNSLVNACVVRIRAGSFTLANGFNLSSPFVIVRGAGPDSTLFTMSANSATSCGYSHNTTIILCAGGGYGGTITNWTAGYSKGTTSVTIADRTGIIANRTWIVLYQLNDEGYPDSNGVYLTDGGAPYSGTANACGDPTGVGVAGSCVAQRSMVTACSGGCSGAGSITIDPPITGNTFRTGRTNEARHYDSVLQWVGIEDISIDFSSAAADQTGAVQISNCTNCWMKNVRTVNTGTASHGIIVLRVARVSIVDSYFYRTNYTDQNNYSVLIQGVGSALIQNNIWQGPGGIVTDNAFDNSVISYNFFVGGGGVSYAKHLGGEQMNLLEGNIGKSIWADNIDAVSCCHVAFRNALVGNAYNAGSIGNVHSPFAISCYNRMWSIVGNVMGDSSLYSTYEGTGDDSTIYGFGGDVGGSGCSTDTLVAGTAMRWGNWDDVTSTSPTTDGDQTGTRWESSEVPSGIGFMPNPVPSTQTLPSSLYLSAKPSWFGSLAWPGIGPDISGGTVSNKGGHIRLNPAADCYLNTMSGPTNGSGSALTFSCW
jgi:hypothetical protein